MRIFKNEKGFSLIEMLVAISVSSLVGLFIFKIFNTQQKLFSGEQKVMEMQSGARLAMTELTKQIRTIGYDPEEAGTSVFGLTDSSFSTSSAAAISTDQSIYYTADLDDDKLLGANETFAYRLNGTVLEEQIGGAVVWRTVSRNITNTGCFPAIVDPPFSISYTYEDGTTSNGIVNLPSNTTASRNFQDVRAVIITITTRSDSPHNLTKQYACERVSSTIALRNNTGI